MTKKELLEENESLRSRLDRIKEKANALIDEDEEDDDDEEGDDDDED